MNRNVIIFNDMDLGCETFSKNKLNMITDDLGGNYPVHGIVDWPWDSAQPSVGQHLRTR